MYEKNILALSYTNAKRINPSKSKSMKTKKLDKKLVDQLKGKYTAFKKGTSIAVIKKYQGKGCLLVRCEEYIFDVTRNPFIYFKTAK